MKKLNMIELISYVISLLFALAISLYHVSYDGYLGLSESTWGSVWALSENGFSLTLCVIVFLFTFGILRSLFKYVFIPYFTLKLIYHISCYSGIYICSPDTWIYIWSSVCVLLFICGLTILLIKKPYV
jgi:hypothetical protein